MQRKLPRIFVDSGKWYPLTLERLGFRYTDVAFGPRSAIERFLSLIDWKTRRFWEKFTYKNTPTSLLRWVEAFTGFTNCWTGKC